ncbi:hypothetical protein IE53DRAFT_359592 [Violaceomyces palustris]|uniref:Uncharacterized protein n=1 Tax=Violaceomyces palustris TaxID=1673888 RepID=A0ACD0P6Z6_9BASI|nr:hypothetical protein IE53DRAFT_359592 [Violaceomyces palustris]
MSTMPSPTRPTVDTYRRIEQARRDSNASSTSSPDTDDSYSPTWERSKPRIISLRLLKHENTEEKVQQALDLGVTSGVGGPRWSIAIRTTCFEDGLGKLYGVQEEPAGVWWPATNPVTDSTCLHGGDSSTTKKITTLKLGRFPLPLHEFERLVKKLAMPDSMLGESGLSWCLDLIMELELKGFLESGQALDLEKTYVDDIVQPID